MSKPFMPVTLQTDRGFVAEVEIPPFSPLPDVINWGSRVFTLHKDEAGKPPVYQEAFAWTVLV